MQTLLFVEANLLVLAVLKEHEVLCKGREK